MLVTEPGAYPPIEAYGVVGNLETCALVVPNGSVDWFPFPHLESPSILAAILDAERSGWFRITPAGSFETNRRYVDDTNVLETTFQTDGATVTVTDFLPPTGHVAHPKKVLYRKVACIDGTVDLEVELDPQFDYGRAEASIESVEKGILADGENERTLLETPLEIDDGRITGDLSLEDGETEWFLLRCTGVEDTNTDPDAALEETLAYWTDRAHSCGPEDDCAFEGSWHDQVVRSELVLKPPRRGASGSARRAPSVSS